MVTTYDSEYTLGLPANIFFHRTYSKVNLCSECSVSTMQSTPNKKFYYYLDYLNYVFAHIKSGQVVGGLCGDQDQVLARARETIGRVLTRPAAPLLITRSRMVIFCTSLMRHLSFYRHHAYIPPTERSTKALAFPSVCASSNSFIAQSIF